MEPDKNLSTPPADSGIDAPAADDPLKGIAPEVIAAIESKAKKEMQSEIDRRVNKHVAENNELRKKLEDAALQSMTEKQKAEYELSKREEALKDRENQIAIERANYLKTKALSENGLPSDAMEFVTGRTPEEITESVNKLKAMIETAKKAGIENALKGVNSSPERSNGNTSATVIAQLEKDFADAKRSGDMVRASRLERMIREAKEKK